ncbi:immunoglobulin superfamily member 5 [Acanthochromis polyacanthus]|uniref:immunoglobulin superfamily member 5 n=1 Tax=Acanthochromis polyacanthus TaxID=80966 RepID=UPI0022346874|nr:immunoglobulin superfamily member 5 [Acanthochromis polyacanthus]XP_022048997.2 immunoglobulin superfamily member 5 [Acanthochromis polyacanthus]XP_051793348.1 immunoglobulin superfamily member 5 [Acanthochromis polyacanthus]XP_051793349.1 immunoglobulin superfamily member 5 [Acanthochromis polyacanthus]
MPVSWKSWASLLHISLLLCATGVVSEEVQLEPLNSTVLEGSEVRFNATVVGTWQIMTWTVQEFLVLTLSKTGDITPSSEQFSARFCSSDNSCVEFTIHNVTRSQSGSVTCTVQGNFGPKTAQLYVQESGAVSIVGGNMTVNQDQQVEFQCVTTAWFPVPTVSWTRNGAAVNSSLYNTTSVADGDSFNSTSILQFQAVSDTTVTCLATVPTLPNPQSSSVFLQVVPKPPDWTVLIAVVVSFGSAGLLAFLIIGIILCYKRRKEQKPNYQDDMRRVRSQSQLSGVNAASRKRGEDNTAYVPEDQTSVAPSDVIDRGFFQMPDIVNITHTGTGSSSTDNIVDESGFKKHRHVTIV